MIVVQFSALSYSDLTWYNGSVHHEQISNMSAATVQKPQGVLLTGGESSSSVEITGLENLSVPNLPEWRYNHGGFFTEWGSPAVCGGLFRNQSKNGFKKQ